MIADKARLIHARKIERVSGCRLSDRAFHGNMLEVLNGEVNLDMLDGRTRDQVLAFLEDFVRCRCKKSPHCGCPERRFARTLLELREEGLDHRQISQTLAGEYGIEIFPADVLSYLEESVHLLEAVTEIAALKGRKALAEKAAVHIEAIER